MHIIHMWHMGSGSGKSWLALNDPTPFTKNTVPPPGPVSPRAHEPPVAQSDGVGVASATRVVPPRAPSATVTANATRDHIPLGRGPCPSNVIVRTSSGRAHRRPGLTRVEG